MIESSLKLEKELKEKEMALKNMEVTQLNAQNTRLKLRGIIAFLVFLTLIMVAFYQYRLTNLRKTEALKRDLALNFHDNTANTINGINRIAQIIREKKLSKLEQNRELERISKLSSNALSSITDIIWSLQPEGGQLKDLVLRVEDFVANEINDLDNIFAIEVDPELDLNKKIDGQTRHQLLMVLKEAIMNTIKHSYPTKVSCQFTANDSLLDIQVVNWFEKKKIAEHSSGIGLNGIAQRVQELKGEIEVEDAVDHFILLIKI